MSRNIDEGKLDYTPRYCSETAQPRRLSTLQSGTDIEHHVAYLACLRGSDTSASSRTGSPQGPVVGRDYHRLLIIKGFSEYRCIPLEAGRATSHAETKNGWLLMGQPFDM